MLRSFTISSLRDRLQIFYVLALLPLPIIAYFNVKSGTLGAIIALYGFILLYLKKPNLSSHPEASIIQRYVGFIVITSSFLLHYALVPFIPEIAYYGSANYTTYIFGLFLVFFNLSALKEAFSPLFLILVSSSIPSVKMWLEPYFSSYVPHFVQSIALILKTLGENVTAQYPNIITFHTSSGNISVPIAWECVGAYSTLVFSVILVILMSEEQAEIKTKTLWSIVGIIGTFIVNIIRITMILLAYRYYGPELAWTIHNYIGGYVLFFAWLVAFLYIFSKRQVISKIVRSLWKRLAQN